MSSLEDMGKLEPVFDALRGSWDDIDASWVYVMDTDEDGKVTVYSDYSGSGITYFIAKLFVIAPIPLYLSSILCYS